MQTFVNFIYTIPLLTRLAWLFVLLFSPFTIGSENNLPKVQEDSPATFKLSQSLKVNYSVKEMIFGDIDNDGDLDMIASTYGAVVFINDGSGNFSQRERITSDKSEILSIALADIDGDNDLDLITAGRGVPMSIYWNDGAGDFTKKSYQFSVEYSDPESMYITDIDNDNDLDIITSNNKHAAVIYFNKGAGRFAATGKPIGIKLRTEHLLLGDINGDNHLDLITYVKESRRNERENGINFFMGDGKGDFIHKQELTFISEKIYTITAGDIDDDANLDLIISGWDYSKVLLNSGAGNFSIKDTLITDKFSDIDNIMLTDIDNDCDLDMLVINKRAENSIYINGGSGKFVNQKNQFGPSIKHTWSTALADFDGDLDLDLVFIIRDQEFSIEFYNNATKQQQTNCHKAKTPPATLVTNIEVDSNSSDAFQTSSLAFAPAIDLVTQDYLKAFAAADFDGDKLVDLLTVHTENRIANLTFYKQKTKGVLSPYFTISGDSFDEVSEVSFADLDNDGDQDLMIGWFQSPDTIHLNDGNGQFESTGTQLGYESKQTKRFDVFDINNDGHVDIFVSAKDGTTLYINNGMGEFQNRSLYAIPSVSSPNIAIADFDKDGDPDLIMGNKPVRLLLNRGNGTFNISEKKLSNNKDIYRIEIADIENDGDMDLLLNGVFSEILVNDGNGQFSYPRALKIPSSSSFVDFDLDGYVDILGIHSSFITVALNDGSGGWAPHLKDWMRGARKFIPIDMDSDGDLDILTLSKNSRNIYLYINTIINDPQNNPFFKEIKKTKPVQNKVEAIGLEKALTNSGTAQTNSESILSQLSSTKNLLILAGILFLYILWRRR